MAKQFNQTQLSEILQGLGGAENIVAMDNCLTRVRVQVKDSKKIDRKRIQKAGAPDAVVSNYNSVQVIVGTNADEITAQLKQLI